MITLTGKPFGATGKAVSLQQHDFEVEYRRGTLNHMPDALPRQPLEEGEDAADTASQKLQLSHRPTNAMTTV